MMRIFIIQVHDPVIHLEVNEELFLTFSALVANPKKTTFLHGGQSRLWSAEQGKK